MGWEERSSVSKLDIIVDAMQFEWLGLMYSRGTHFR